MSVTKQDLGELKRMATNTYDDDKKFLNRVIVGVTLMEREIFDLKAKISKLEKRKTGI